jgi:processive 1,2-diacylglycerol beta-glucosyltransferase
VRLEDTLDHAHTLFRKVYAGLYLGIADHIPAFWSHFYNQTDRSRSLQPVIEGVRAWSTQMGVHGLQALLEETQPDAVICTHFLPLEVLGPLRQQGAAPPLFGVVTDYRSHHFWACPGVDGYFVPTAAAKQQLAAAGIAPAQIQVTGIPIDPRISQPLEQAGARQMLGLKDTRPVVLLNGSGIATARVRAIAQALLDGAMPGTLLVAAGRNHKLLAALSDLVPSHETELVILGQQPSLDPLIAASDLVIGKAGGLTVSEVLGRGVPLIIPTPVPGQEQANADFVIAAGAGTCQSMVQDVAADVFALLADPARRTAMAAAARAAGRPSSAVTIATHVLGSIGRGVSSVPQRSLVMGSTAQQFALFER